MFRFHIQGLCVAVLKDDGMQVLMLNSGPPRTVPDVPYHLPTLIAPRAVVVRYDIPRLSGVLGRWALNTIGPDELMGWSLSGLHLRAGTAGPVERPASTQTGDIPPRVSLTQFDWRDLHWVVDARKVLPSARLRANFSCLGDDTHAIFEFHGGRLEGGVPFGTGGAQYVWQYREGYKQAFTDTLDVVFETKPPVIEVKDCDGSDRGSIEFAADGEAWIVHEAPSRAVNQIAGSGICPDTRVLFQAFDTSPEHDPETFIKMERGEKFGPAVPDGESCNMILLDERAQ